MANLSSIARPYALAAFKYAKEKQTLASWKAFLEFAAQVAQDQQAARILENPNMPDQLLFELFQDVLKSALDSEKSNFLKLVSQNKRLSILPAISEFFNALYASFEKLSQVKITTAIEPQALFKEQISLSLTKRFDREVALECEIDPEIIGGAIIQIGDRVIDGSVRGKLQRLSENLLS